MNIKIEPKAVQLDCQVDTKEAAQILGVKVGTLYAWRHSGKHVNEIGPHQFQIGGRYRYRLADLLAFRRQLPKRENAQKA